MFGLDILGGLVSEKSNLPDYQTFDLGQEQLKAIGANATALPKLENLASKINAFNSTELAKALRASIPGYDAIVNKSSGVIQDELAGKIPKDVQDLIQNSAAARAIGGGFSGSGLGRNLVARDLGLTSLNLIQSGLDTGSRWLQNMKNLSVPGQFDFSSMFISPMQQFAADTSNAQSQFSHDWLKEQIDSAYSPRNIVGNSLINTENTLDQMAVSFVGSMGGGMMGGMGGGGGGGGSTSQSYNPNTAYGGGFKMGF